MHEDPALGAVNANRRMHAVLNLYVAGSSVFPTGGAKQSLADALLHDLPLAHLLRREKV